MGDCLDNFGPEKWVRRNTPRALGVQRTLGVS